MNFLLLVLFATTCFERKIDRIVQKNCKHQQGFLHPTKAFSAVLQRFFRILVSERKLSRAAVTMPSCPKNPLEVHRHENATETTQVPTAGIRKGRRGGATITFRVSLRVSSSIAVLIRNQIYPVMHKIKYRL